MTDLELDILRTQLEASARAEPPDGQAGWLEVLDTAGRPARSLRTKPKFADASAFQKCTEPAHRLRRTCSGWTGGVR